MAQELSKDAVIEIGVVGSAKNFRIRTYFGPDEQNPAQDMTWERLSGNRVAFIVVPTQEYMVSKEGFKLGKIKLSPKDPLFSTYGSSFSNYNELEQWAEDSLGESDGDGGGNGATSFAELSGTIADNQVSETAVTQYKRVLYNDFFGEDDYLKILNSKSEFLENKKYLYEQYDYLKKSEILEKASFVFIPSAYSNGLLHAIKPIDGSGDFTMTRASTGTRINEKGNSETLPNNIPKLDYSLADYGVLKLDAPGNNGTNRDVVVDGANSNVINSTEGVLHVVFKSEQTNPTGKFTIRDDSNDNYISLEFNGGAIYLAMYTDGVYQGGGGVTVDTSTNLSYVSIVWAENRLELWVNGYKQLSDYVVDTALADSYSKFAYGNGIGTWSYFAGEIHKTVIFDSINEKHGWGDSLTQYYPEALVRLEGTPTVANTYGGESSTQVRTRFLANADFDKPTIIWVGRNNYSEVSTVLDDVAQMVAALTHENYVVLTPPNGGNQAEMVGGTFYQNFLDIERGLANTYGTKFLNNRKLSIENYDMGGVYLTSSFVQPAINGTVQISVTDTDIFENENSIDVTTFSTYAGKLRIGTKESSDLYDVVSVDSDTLITIELLESNLNDVGSTVDDLQVFSQLDYYCYINKTTLSTFRRDAIHMSKIGQEFIARLISENFKY